MPRRPLVVGVVAGVAGLVLAMGGVALAAGPGSAGAGTLAATAGCGRAPTLTSGSHTISSGGQNRSYILRIPDNYDNNHPYRLIFGFHWNGGNSPDVLIVDNPVISTLAQAGALTAADETGLDTSASAPNLLGAGRLDGKAYGVPIGANTLALWYNKDLLGRAGVDVASIRDWPSLTAALAKVKGAGKKGITFSAIGTEEGSFQFLPWFWGSGAQLTALDSPRAVSALTLWKDWLTRGYAPNSVITNTQTTSWQEFAAGDYAFAENGTWQQANAEKLDFAYGIIPVPGSAGGTAPAPTGGEFVSVPVQRDTGRYDVSRKLVACLTNPDNLLTTDTTLSYVAPVAAVQQKQVAADPGLKVWVDAVNAAKGRTGDNLGTRYPRISEQLWTAVQGALSGAKSPQAALTAAQGAAAAAR
ncbi:extracellular solute-binding protein [Micromonospora sp. NPDC051300]|uniref:sugar ABC transporter substrate-binding protein n=1 Tax=Micromonospora sp. NPDC051300 TaxID=3364286 RepID=UPI0037B13099